MFDLDLRSELYEIKMLLRLVLRRTGVIIQKENEEMADIDALIAQSAQALTAVRALADPLVSIKTLLDNQNAQIKTLTDEIAANANDPAKVAQLTQNLTDLLAATDTQAQAEAALANTPAEPPPAP